MAWRKPSLQAFSRRLPFGLSNLRLNWSQRRQPRLLDSVCPWLFEKPTWFSRPQPFLFNSLRAAAPVVPPGASPLVPPVLPQPRFPAQDVNSQPGCGFSCPISSSVAHLGPAWSSSPDIAQPTRLFLLRLLAPRSSLNI